MIKSTACLILFLSVASVTMIGCSSDDRPGDAAVAKFRAQPAEEQYKWVKGQPLPLAQKMGQIDAIPNATADQKKQWKDELTKEAGGAAAPTGNPMEAQRAAQGK